MPALAAVQTRGERALGTAGTAMKELGQHRVLRLRRDRNIAPTVEERRLLARTVLTVGRDFPLVAFNWGDTHGHGAVMADEEVAAEWARRTESALKQALRLPVPFAPVELTPIKDVWHLKNLVKYVFTQDKHHGYQHDRFHEGSTLSDALGLRTLGAGTARRLKEQQPRLRRFDLLEMVGMNDPDLPPRWDGDWHDALAAATCRPHARGKHRDAVMARAAIVQLAHEELPQREICDRLGVSPRAYKRLLERKPPAAVIRAVRQQLVLRSPTFVRSAKEAVELAEAAALGASPGEGSLAEPERDWRIIEP